MTFLFCDTQIIDPAMLEDINNVLNSGDVPNLYKKEDEESIFSSARVECSKKGITPTKMNMFQQFLQKMKKNIHVVLAMSHIGDKFSNYLR